MRALAIREKVLDPEHPDVAQSLENYAALLRKTGRGNEAAWIEARAKAIRADLELGAHRTRCRRRHSASSVVSTPFSDMAYLRTSIFRTDVSLKRPLLWFVPNLWPFRCITLYCPPRPHVHPRTADYRMHDVRSGECAIQPYLCP